jgi:hypothetical protein
MRDYIDRHRKLILMPEFFTSYRISEEENDGCKQMVLRDNNSCCFTYLLDGMQDLLKVAAETLNDRAAQP